MLCCVTVCLCVALYMIHCKDHFFLTYTGKYTTAGREPSRHIDEIFAAYIQFSSRIILYLTPSIFTSTLTGLPVSSESVLCLKMCLPCWPNLFSLEENIFFHMVSVSQMSHAPICKLDPLQGFFCPSTLFFVWTFLHKGQICTSLHKSPNKKKLSYLSC